jgi:DNA-directed RNA polymerase specialized sigma24 family protein
VGSVSFDQARRELENAAVRATLLRFARSRATDDADARDLLQQALLKTFDPDDSPWDPDCGKTFFRHVGSIINGLAANQRRRADRRGAILETPAARDALEPAAPPPADEALDVARTDAALRQAGQTLLERLGPRDDVAIQVLAAARRGADTAEQQARAIGCGVDEVRAAHRRLKYHASALIEEQRVADEQQMAELRERSERASGKEVAR